MIMLEQYAPTSETSLKQPATEPFLIGCPICGRPAKVRHQYIDQELACSHCRGTFIVNEKMNGSRTARSTVTARQSAKEKTPDRSKPERSAGHPMTNPKPRRVSESKSRPIAFVVEPRDEVYSRLAGDLIEAGYRVIRALSATDALKACGKNQPKLVVAQLALPNQKAWQLAPKLAILDSDTRVMLYGNQVDIHDYAMADFLGVEQLIEYRGDLFSLSSRIRKCLCVQLAEKSESESKYRHVA